MILLNNKKRNGIKNISGYLIIATSLILFLLLILSSISFGLLLIFPAGVDASMDRQMSRVANEENNTSGDDPPPIQWWRTYGGYNTDKANSIRQTNDGKYIISGTTAPFVVGLTNLDDPNNLYYILLGIILIVVVIIIFIFGFTHIRGPSVKADPLKKDPDDKTSTKPPPPGG